MNVALAHSSGRQIRGNEVGRFFEGPWVLALVLPIVCVVIAVALVLFLVRLANKSKRVEKPSKNEERF
jgi:uncharacterized membrane protein